MVIAVAALACLAPALRAMSADPMAALRREQGQQVIFLRPEAKKLILSISLFASQDYIRVDCNGATCRQKAGQRRRRTDHERHSYQNCS
jgi:hypothetical protein